MLNWLRNWIEEQKIKQMDREKKELAYLKERNKKAAEQYEVRVQLKAERDKAKKFSQNPLFPNNERDFIKPRF